MVIHHFEKLTTAQILEIDKIGKREGIEEVFQIADNKGGSYFQGKPRGGALQKFTIERKANEIPNAT